MARKIQVLASILSVVFFTGCYTQLHAPGYQPPEPPKRTPPQERPGLSQKDFQSTRVDVYLHSSFPLWYDTYLDPWDIGFYDPYQTWWIRRTLFPHWYGPFSGGDALFWHDSLYLGNRVLLYGMDRYWYLFPLYSANRWRPRYYSPVDPPPPVQTIAPRSRIQRSGFSGGEAPSGSTVRQPEPTQPQMTAPPPPPPPPPPEKEDEEQSKEEKREEKRDRTKQRGGMR